MLQVQILGSLTLLKEDESYGDSFLAGPKRVALLTYLMLARPRGFHRRDKLTALFWPESSQKGARNALSNMLYQIRHSLGKESVLNRGIEEVSLNRDNIWCDALAFEEFINEGNPTGALDLYRDDLLTGFHVSEVSNNFTDWLESERNRLRQMAFDASWSLAERAEKSGQPGVAQTWGKKAVSYMDFSEDACIELLKLLDRIGHRTEALKVYKEFVQQLKKKWELEPSDDIVQLFEKIKAGKSTGPSSPTLNGFYKNRERSIAVIPFENIGTEKISIFTGGIHGEIVTRLTGLSELQVISRTSVKKYANSNKTIFEIGRELNVEYILEGEVQETENEVRVNVRLINSRDDRQLWASDFRRKITAHNLFQIQSLITKKIARALQAKLSPKEKARVEERPTSQIDAYRLYMQGWIWIEQRTEKGMRRGLDYFREAAEKDAYFTLALVGQALALLGLHGYGHQTSDGTLFDAEDLINQALDQDPDLAEAYAARGLLLTGRQQGPEAEEALKQALELRPGHANTHNKLSWLYQLLGQPAKALKYAKNAVELDPFSPEAVINFSFSCMINGDLEKALQQAEQAYNLQPTWPTTLFYQGLIQYHRGRYREAGEIVKNLSVPWTGEGPQALQALSELKTGNRKSAERFLVKCKKQNDYFHAGLMYATFGENQKALEKFKMIKTWQPWPAHAIYYLFPGTLQEIRTDLVYGKILNNLKQSWGLTIS